MWRMISMTAILLYIALGLGRTVIHAQENPTEPPAATVEPTTQPSNLEDPQDRMSYSLGLMIGRNVKASMSQYGEVKPELVAAGINDMLTNRPPILSNQEIQTAINQLQQQVQARVNALAEQNKKEGEAFLAANMTKPDVHTTESGLQYKILQEGTGASPKQTDKVKVHYKGTLLDGTVFDNSLARGVPMTFAVKGVIPGWTEALQLMKVGGKWQIFVPPNLGYGGQGNQRIPPHAVLTFEMELLGIE